MKLLLGNVVKKKILMFTLVPICLILLVGLTGYVWSSVRMNRSYSIEARPINIPGDATAVERGRRIAVGVTKCVDCHGSDMGGLIVVDDPALGLFAGPNLTPGKSGVLDGYSDAELARAIRYGVRRDGTPIKFMPAGEFTHLSDSDTADLIAFLRALPPVDRVLPESSVGPLARFLYVAGELPMLTAVENLDLSMKQPENVVRAATEEYGKYLIATGGCNGCHGMELKGGHVPGTPPDHPDFPPATNIRQSGVVNGWTEADFIKTMRTGIRPNGVPIHPFMPYKAVATLADDDLKALWKALVTYK